MRKRRLLRAMRMLKWAMRQEDEKLIRRWRDQLINVLEDVNDHPA